MKIRESGMPEEDYWNSFFDAELLIETLVASRLERGDVVEFGSGYGTFTVPLAKKISGIVYGFDIETDLVSLLDKKCKRLCLANVQLETRDFVEKGTGLLDGSAAHAMIYNILHIENPVALLSEAFRILKPDGAVSVIHWRSDISTPRGPSLNIRPTSEQCQQWGKQAGFKYAETIDISIMAPYHYGICFYKTEK